MHCHAQFKQATHEHAVPLALSMLCRDEADIIEANIRHHAALGVECFVVTDLGSTDGTREILTALAEEFDLQLFDDTQHGIDPDIRLTRMAHWLLRHRGAGWVIPCDPDEFWVAAGSSLQVAFAHALQDTPGPVDAVGSLLCERFNRLPSHETLTDPDYGFWLHTWQAEETLQLPQQRPWGRDDDHLLVRRLSGRTVTRLAAPHLAISNTAVSEVPSSMLRVLRFPVRGYGQFERTVVNHGSGLACASRHGQMMSRQYSHWYDAWLDGRLGVEYDRLFFNDQELEMLRQAGIVSRQGVFRPAGSMNLDMSDWRKAS